MSVHNLALQSPLTYLWFLTLMLLTASIVVGHPVTKVMQMTSVESVPFAFSFVEGSCHASSHGTVLKVTPMDGVIQPHSRSVHITCSHQRCGANYLELAPWQCWVSGQFTIFSAKNRHVRGPKWFKRNFFSGGLGALPQNFCQNYIVCGAF